MTMLSRRLTMVLLGAAALSACAGLPFSDERNGAAGDYAAGSALAGRLSGDDRRALADAFEEAMETGRATRWRGGAAVGTVAPGDYALGNLLPGPTARLGLARVDLDLSAPMETELGLHALRANSNVRTGPGTDYAVIETLPAGTGVDGVGRPAGSDWMLVAIDGVARGYIFDDLLVKAPGTELELAGGPQREARLCRDFTQRVSLYSESDEWSGAACRENGVWRVQEEPPGPVYLEGL